MEELTLIELKAKVYDCFAEIERLNKLVPEINALIEKKIRQEKEEPFNKKL